MDDYKKKYNHNTYWKFENAVCEAFKSLNMFLETLEVCHTYDDATKFSIKGYIEIPECLRTGDNLRKKIEELGYLVKMLKFVQYLEDKATFEISGYIY